MPTDACSAPCLHLCCCRTLPSPSEEAGLGPCWADTPPASSTVTCSTPVAAAAAGLPIRSPAVRDVRCRSFPTPPTPPRHPATFSNPSAFFPLAGRRALRPLIVTPNSICSCHSSPERTMNIQGLLGGNVWQMLGTIQLVYTKLVVQARQARQAARLMPADCNWIWPHVRCPRCPPAAAR